MPLKQVAQHDFKRVQYRFIDTIGDIWRQNVELSPTSSYKDDGYFYTSLITSSRYCFTERLRVVAGGLGGGYKFFLVGE